MVRESTAPATRPWHTESVATVASTLGTDSRTGLTAPEALARLARHGPNRLPQGRVRGPLAMFVAQFADFMVLVLFAAALVSGLVGDAKDTIAILVIIVLNTIIGFAQEHRAERAMAALRRMAAPGARVVRDGAITDVAADALVPGDVVLLEAGNVVPADLRLAQAARLATSEAALTGESQPLEKGTTELADPALPVGDRHNMAWKGTTVVSGRGTGLVVATGAATELGRIARLLGDAESARTPLQRRLAAFGTRLAWAVLAICALVFAAGVLRGEPPVLMFLTAVSLAVAAIPEALPAVVTISLALGARRMVRQNALIRRLPAVETLGSITCICSDKTGTLTQNRMRVEALRAGGESVPGPHEPWPALAAALALCNDTRPGADGVLRGDPTETALYEAAIALGVDPAALAAAQPRIAELPFDAVRRRMTTVHATGGGAIVYVKGAPEAVLPCVTRQAGARGPRPPDRAAVLAEADALAGAGLRVLAVARRRFDGAPPPAADCEQDLELLGLVGLLDPPREEVPQAVAECRAAGITPIMITGDHPATARAIAARLGILADGGRLLTGPDLARMDDATLAAHAREVRVYARVDPEQKIRIVRALQANGEYVAMTGDGVNDAPALASAEIGVAMGRSGTDVAREAAHMTLLDDNFATIVHAVREGRRIYDNIRRFIKYTMTSNSGEIWTIFLAPFLGMPIPLLPIHILWINLVTDGLPGLALAAEPAGDDVMRRPPRPPRESVFAHGLWQHVLWVGLLMGAVCLLLQAWALHTGEAHWQTMVFTVLCLSQLGHVLAIRSEHASLVTLGLRSNLPLLAAVAFTVALQLATIYVPWCNAVFRTAPLSAADLGVCLAASAVVFVAVEAEKALVRRGWLYGES